MRGSTHTAAGVLIALILSSTLTPLPTLGMVTAGGLGALLPDIDHPQSTIGRRAGLAGGAVRLVVKHRGALHSGAAAIAVMAVAFVVPAPYAAYARAAAVGYVSHIGLDMATVQGVPLFWPRRARVSILPLRTGGLIEKLFGLALALAIVWLIYQRLT